MSLRKHLRAALAPALIVLLACAAPSARAAVADYVGFGWEAGGLGTSDPGDGLAFATVVTQIDPHFEIDLGMVEATLFIDGLVSDGGFVNGATGVTTIPYSGGTLRLYADPSGNHDWGVNPANGTVPGTFVDGELLFEGTFTSFTLILQPSGGGVFEGYLDGTGGSSLAGPCTDCAYTFAGTFASPTGAQIPEGYDLQVDGVLEVESTVAVESLTWGTLKQMFR